MDRVRNEEVRRGAGIERELQSRADQRVLRRFRHVERMDEYYMRRSVLMADVCGGRVRGRPKLGWMDEVKMSFCSSGEGCATMRERGEGAESPGAYVDFCMALRSFGPPSHALVDYHLVRGGMQLHDAVGVNCKRGATTEIQGAYAWYVG